MPELGEAQFHRLLRRFAIERFLYRLGRSPDRERFVLKGAMLLVLFGGKVARPTKDLDLLGFGALNDEELRTVVHRVCSVEVEAVDGLEFQPSELKLAPIREKEEYGGTRLLLPFHMEQARDRIQIDVGLGDAIYPPAVDVFYPTLLDLPPPRIRAYQRETVVAEKTEALVKLGASNSRMKDFFDLWLWRAPKPSTAKNWSALFGTRSNDGQRPGRMGSPSACNPHSFGTRFTSCSGRASFTTAFSKTPLRISPPWARGFGSS